MEETFNSSMSEEERTLMMFEELINVFCQEGRRLDGHEDGEATSGEAEGASTAAAEAAIAAIADTIASEDGSILPELDGADFSSAETDELCREARKQYAEAIRFVRADEDEQAAIIESGVKALIEFLMEGSTFMYVGAATLSAAATLAF